MTDGGLGWVEKDHLEPRVPCVGLALTTQGKLGVVLMGRAAASDQLITKSIVVDRWVDGRRTGRSG